MTHDGFGGKEQRGLMAEALSLLARKSDGRYTVYVADGGSSEGFVNDMGRMGLRVEHVEGGLPAQHRNSIMRAAGDADNVLYVEPDKLDWFGNGMEQSIDDYFTEHSGFAAVARSPEVMATFPIHQQRWERAANECISMVVLGKPGGDFMYGPKLFVGSLARTLDDNTAKDLKGWETLMYLVAQAHRNTLKIDMIFHAAGCPESQRREDNEAYREKQANENISGFSKGIGVVSLDAVRSMNLWDVFGIISDDDMEYEQAREELMRKLVRKG